MKTNEYSEDMRLIDPYNKENFLWVDVHWLVERIILGKPDFLKNNFRYNFLIFRAIHIVVVNYTIMFLLFYYFLFIMNSLFNTNYFSINSANIFNYFHTFLNSSSYGLKQLLLYAVTPTITSVSFVYWNISNTASKKFRYCSNLSNQIYLNLTEKTTERSILWNCLLIDIITHDLWANRSFSYALSTGINTALTSLENEVNNQYKQKIKENKLTTKDAVSILMNHIHKLSEKAAQDEKKKQTAITFTLI